MTHGIGGSTAEIELAKLSNMTADMQPISNAEYQARIQKAQSLMHKEGVDALYVNAGTSLRYFTGTAWSVSERLVAAIIPASGALVYIVPEFEIGTFSTLMQVSGEILSWEEHESPFELIADFLNKQNVSTLAMDDSTPFFMVDGIAKANAQLTIVTSKPIIAECRSQKSDVEIAIMQRANDMTIVVHKAVAKILRAGIDVNEVEAFIDEAHQRVGAVNGSAFCIVLFGPDSAFPHGVKSPKTLENNDVVLIDTGCRLYGYFSDITRTYVFGAPTEHHRQVWDDEKQAQAHAFAAAQLGTPCAAVDKASRAYLESKGYGPDYKLPGLSHRTGHSIGLDIHESPYLVGSDQTLLAEGMCFSNEPMICVPGEFGIRHEDHFYMTKNGPKWFTEPAYSIDDPFHLG